MNIALYFLIVCFIVVIALLFSILFYRPDISSLAASESVPLETEKEEMAFHENNRKKEILDSISIRWPDLSVMLEDVSNDHILLLRWKGMVEKEEILLFHICQRQTFRALFAAMSHISEANLPMKYRVLFSFEDTIQLESDYRQLSYTIHGFHAKIHAAITDGDGILSGRNRDFLCVSCGSFAEMTLKLDGNNLSQWFDSLKPEELAKPVAGDLDGLKKLMKDMNFIMELQYRFYQHRFIDNFIALNPAFVSQFYPEISFEHNRLSFTAVNDAQKEEVLTALRSSASHYGIIIQAEKEKAAVPVASRSEIDNEIDHAAALSNSRLEVVRLLKKRDDFHLIPGITTRGVTPVCYEDSEDFKVEEQVLFYQNLLRSR